MPAPTESKKVRIFLAHASEDKQAVIKLYKRLKQQGYEPWLDKMDLLAGQKWREEIPKAIRNSDIFIACLSKQSVAKQGYIQREFRMALNKCADMPPGKIYLIPLRLDDCRIPELRQEEYGINLRDYHWLDYFEEDGFERLVKSIAHHFPGPAKAITEPTGELTPERVAATSFNVNLGNGIQLELVKIPGGKFLMGSPEEEEDSHNSERPQHWVTVPQFWMGKYPVTQAQWQAVSSLDVVDLELAPNPSGFSGDKLPVERVSWHEAVEFCARLSKHTGDEYRLPSEAEWEYACRAGTKTPYSFGESISREQVNCNGWHRQTTKVGRFPPNAFRLHDMHGNVGEWCLDHWHSNYEGAPEDGNAWLSDDQGAYCVVRGGSWGNYPRYCRSASRDAYNPGYRSSFIGFRVMCRAPRTL
ncbi:MAG: SUMF1/EgtB/PvdO family nonheme iron enzyme [Cyanobacteria bacterium J06639_14]